jgi:ubiquinone/menaquinone biosynthesis C-methylase UbiE
MNEPAPNEKPSPGPKVDPWFDWLTHRRQGGARIGESAGRDVERYRERVLDGAQLEKGMTLVDVGTGDGLIAFGAIARVGPSLKVTLTDISPALLRRAEELADQLGVRGQCTFLEGSAERSPGIPNESTDVVTMRSVLVYIADKAAVAREFHRMLKPGGRISIAEPIYRDEAMNLEALARQVASQPDSPATRDNKLFLRWKTAQMPSTMPEIDASPLTSFSEHDLVTIFERAGFGDIHLELHIDTRRLAAQSWESILDAAPRPNTPTLREVLASRFTEEERRHFESLLRPLAEGGQTFYRDTMAYLTAVKRA